MRSRFILPLALVVLALFRLWMSSGQTLRALAGAVHDDHLFLKLAEHILAGRWLGPFDNLTLAKGPFYPLWIAATFVLGVPLQLSQHLLYVGACVAAVVALRPAIRSVTVLIAIYIVLLFNPIAFGNTRILREGIYVPLTLLLAACLISLYLRRGGGLCRLAFWAGGAGLTLGIMWLTRGENLWVLPAVGFVLAATAVALWRARSDRLWSRCLVVVSPLAVMAAVTGAVSTINHSVYGVFVTTEVAGANWLAAYGALSRVEHDRWQQYVVVPRHVRERIYGVSPAFAELRPSLEGDLGRGWMSHGCRMMPHTCGDITAGWFMWLLRDAVARAGYYRSAPTAGAYYRRLADEVNAACRSGALRCGPPRATMVPPWRAEYFPLLVRWLPAAAKQVVRFEEISPHSGPSHGTTAALFPFRTLTRERLAPTAATTQLRIHGWAFSPISDLTITVRDSANREAEYYVKDQQASPSVFEHCVATKVPNCEGARRAFFQLLTPCTSNCALVVMARGTDRVLATLPLDGPLPRLFTPDLKVHVDTVRRDTESLPAYAADTMKLDMLTALVWVYAQLGPVLACVLALTLLVAPIAVAFGYRSRLLVPLVMLAMGIAGRIGLITLIHATSFPAIHPHYLGPTHSLLLFGGVLACVEVASMWKWLDARVSARVAGAGVEAGDAGVEAR